MTLRRKLLRGRFECHWSRRALGGARAQVVTPRPEELRFEAVLNEPIADSDHRNRWSRERPHCWSGIAGPGSASSP